MTIDFCALCDDPCTGANAIIGNNNMQEQWRTLVAQTLCGILANINPDTVDPTQLPQVAKTAAQLTSGFSTYANSGFLTSAKKVREFTATNNTDANIEISLDGGVSTNFTILANTVRTIDIGNHTFTNQTDFQIRIASGMTATLGSFYLDGRY